MLAQMAVAVSLCRSLAGAIQLHYVPARTANFRCYKDDLPLNIQRRAAAGAYPTLPMDSKLEVLQRRSAIEHPAPCGCRCIPYPTLPYPRTANLRCYKDDLPLNIQRRAAAGAYPTLPTLPTDSKLEVLQRLSTSEHPASRGCRCMCSGARRSGSTSSASTASRFWRRASARRRGSPSRRALHVPQIEFLINSRDAVSDFTLSMHVLWTRGHGFLSRRTQCELQQLSTPH